MCALSSIEGEQDRQLSSHKSVALLNAGAREAL